MMRLIGLLAFLSICTPAYAATYYVAPSGGSDSNDGTVGSPFATIQHGINTATSPGDILCLMDGTHRPTALTTKFANSGTEGNPITINNCQGGEVIVDASTHVSGWTSLGSNLWEANTGNVGVGSYVFKDTTWIGVGKANANCGLVDTQDEWCVSANGRIQTYSTTDPSLLTYRITRTTFQMWNVSYITFDGIKVHYTNFGYNIGYSNSGSPTPTQQTHNIIIKNGEVAYTGSRGIRIIGSILWPTHHVYIEDNVLHDSYEVGSANGHCIKFDSNDDGYHNSFAYATGNTIYNCGANGIQFSDGWRDAFFSDNTVHDTSQRTDGTYCAIRCGDTFNCNIFNNTVYGGTIPFGSGICLNEKAQPSHVYGNHVSGFNYYGIFSAKQVKSPAEIHIYNNIVTSNDRGGIVIQDTNEFYVYSNTLSQNGGTAQLGVSSGGNTGGIVRNNIISSTSSAVTAMSSNVGITEDHNLFKGSSSALIKYAGTNYTLAAYQTASSQGTGSISADPLFIGGGDLHLQATSPAINAGTPLGYDYDTDFDGDRRPQGSGWDMGAYEYTIPSYGMKGGATNKGGAKLK